MKPIPTLAAAALVAALVLPAAQADERTNPERLAFGILSTESSSAQRDKWGPMLADLEKAIGIPVDPFFASDYAGVIEAMRFDKVDVAWYGNKSAMVAVDRAGAEVFAQTTEANGDQGYWSLMVTHKDSGLTYADVMKCDGTLNFGIGDPNSTSGFLVPTTFIFAKEGVDPKTCFRTVRNANHESNLVSVATGQVDAAVANNVALYKRLAATRPELAANIREIWRSPLIASDPLAWRPELDATLKAKIMSFFMTYGRHGTPEEIRDAREKLALVDMGPLVPSSNAQLWPFREMEVNKEMLKTQSDETLSDDERTARIDELKGRLSEIRAAAEALPRK